MADGATRLRWKAPWAAGEAAPSEERWRPSRRARQLALGVWIERQIEAGRVESYADMARILGVSRARVTQLVGLGLRPVGVREGWLCGMARDGGGTALMTSFHSAGSGRDHIRPISPIGTATSAPHASNTPDHDS